MCRDSNVVFDEFRVALCVYIYDTRTYEVKKTIVVVRMM